MSFGGSRSIARSHSHTSQFSASGSPAIAFRSWNGRSNDLKSRSHYSRPSYETDYPSRRRHIENDTTFHRSRTPDPDHDYRFKPSVLEYPRLRDEHFEDKLKLEDLQRKYDQLFSKYSDLRSAHEALTTAYGSLTQAIGKRLETETGIPQTQPTTSALPVVFSPPERYQGLTRQNAATRFPFIHFWTAKQFSDWEKEQASTSDVLEVDEKKPQRGNARAKQGENVAYKFVEEEDGKVVDGHVAEAIRRRLQTILNGMAVRLPKKWRQVGNINREYIFNEVYKAYPYLLLCHDDWKAERIASAALSSFHSTTNKRHKREAARAEMTAVKSEEEVKYEAGSTLDANAATKRKASPETETVVAMKRPRLSISTSTTPSDPPSNDIESVKALSGEPRKGPQTEPPAEQPGMDILATVTSPNDRATSISSAQPSHRSDNEQPMDLLATCNGQNEKAALASVSRAEPPQDVQSSPPHSGAERPNVDLHATAGKAKGPGIVNPLTKHFGVPSAPNNRLETLREAQTQASASKSSANDKNTANSSTNPSASSNLKKVTKSNAPKNLCYKAYLEHNNPLTPAAFDTYWKGLSKEEVRKWNNLSKSNKELGASEDNPNDVSG